MTRPRFSIVAAGAAALLLATAAGGAQSAERAEIEAIVRDYILTNPDIVQEALDLIAERASAAEVAQRTEALESNRALLENSPNQMVLGNPEGSVTMVEFFDYNCGFCRRAMGDMLDLIAEEPELRVVLKEFPVLGPGSLAAARVSSAITIMEPGKYLAFHQALLESREQADEAVALAVAEEVGVDMEVLRATLERPEVMVPIQEAYALAEAFGLNGTPSYVIGDEVVIGAVGYDALLDAIETAKGEVE